MNNHKTIINNWNNYSFTLYDVLIMQRGSFYRLLWIQTSQSVTCFSSDAKLNWVSYTSPLNVFYSMAFVVLISLYSKHTWIIMPFSVDSTVIDILSVWPIIIITTITTLTATAWNRNACFWARTPTHISHAIC